MEVFGRLELPWWALVVRGLTVYLFLLVAMRLSGKRQVGQLEPFELVVTILIADALQNSMVGPDQSLWGGLILAGTIFGASAALNQLTFRSRALEELVEGRPRILIWDGRVDRKVAYAEKLTDHEIHQAVREGGCERIEEVKLAYLESNGKINVLPKEK